MRLGLSVLIAVFSFACAYAGDNLGLTTVVIDPGHGGHDPGAVSANGVFQEKAFTLDISTRLAGKIRESYPEVKVIMTRSTDEFISLNERAEIANKNNANFFISIHINASENRKANGYSVHLLGQSSIKDRDLFAYNMDVVKRENSVIFLEDDYSTKYQGFNPDDPSSYIFMQLIQSANLEQSLLFAQMVKDNLRGGPIQSDRGMSQDPFYVLWKTSMPAVLVELGFISNKEDLDTLRSETNREEIAGRLLQAFKDYKDVYDSSVKVEKEVKVDKAAAAGKEVTAGNEVKVDKAAAAGKETKADKKVTVEKEVTPEKVETSGGNMKTAVIPAAPVVPEAKEPEVKTQQTQPAKTETVLYGTQIFAVYQDIPKGDRQFLGYTPQVFGKKLKKYVIGISADKKKAETYNKEIKKKYPDSYMVKIKNGELIF